MAVGDAFVVSAFLLNFLLVNSVLCPNFYCLYSCLKGQRFLAMVGKQFGCVEEFDLSYLSLVDNVKIEAQIDILSLPGVTLLPLLFSPRTIDPFCTMSRRPYLCTKQ